MPRSPVSIATYTNKKGISRVAVQMPRAFALRVAMNDEECVDEIVRVVRDRIEKEERAVSGE